MLRAVGVVPSGCSYWAKLNIQGSVAPSGLIHGGVDNFRSLNLSVYEEHAKWCQRPTLSLLPTHREFWPTHFPNSPLTFILEIANVHGNDTVNILTDTS